MQMLRLPGNNCTTIQYFNKIFNCALNTEIMIPEQIFLIPRFFVVETTQRATSTIS